MKFRTARKINYLKKARHRHGYGIHSPWLFRLITNVIENKKRLPEYKILRDQLDRLSHLIKENNDQTEIKNFSDPILKSLGSKNLYKAVELPFKYGKLLHRLVAEFKPKSVSYFGPTFGLNLLYLALPDKKIPVNFFQSGNYFETICQSALIDAGIHNVIYRKMEELAEVNQDFIFINSAFSPDEVEKIINAYMVTTGDNEILIIRGIHESEGMESIWKDFIKSNRVKVSLDLFEIGIAIFSGKLQKEDFVLKF